MQLDFLWKKATRFWERIRLSLRNLLSRKHGMVYLALIVLAVVAVMALLVWIISRIRWLIALAMLCFLVWFIDRPAPRPSAEDEWEMGIAEVVARTLRRHSSSLGIIAPQKTQDVLPLGRRAKNKLKGYTRFRYVFSSVQGNVDCDAVRGLIQQTLDREFSGISATIIVEDVQESLSDELGYDIDIALNPPQDQAFPPMDGWNGNDLIFDEDFRK